MAIFQSFDGTKNGRSSLPTVYRQPEAVSNACAGYGTCGGGIFGGISADSVSEDVIESRPKKTE
jgi:hypothetical protein